jgi:hypothetical protein
MINLIPLIISALFFNMAGAQLTTNVTWTEQSTLSAAEVIYYSAADNLVWGDFKGKPVEGRAAAVTVSGFGYNARMNAKNGKGQLNISVYCYFHKNKSWVKTGSTIPYILTHEQHHFDLSYIATRLFMQKLRNAVFTQDNYTVLLPKIYTECCDIMNKMQDDYDGQTKNGQLKDVQAKWNDLVDEKISLITK